MPASPTPWTVRLVEVLADGEEHTLDELVIAAGPLVPPGYATRVAERERLRRGPKATATNRLWRPPAARAVATDEIAVGRRILIRDSLHTMSRRQRITFRNNTARLNPPRGTR